MSIARRRIVLIIAGLNLWGLAGCRETPPQPAPPLRLTLEHSAELVLDADYSFGLALAPDGRQLAYVGSAQLEGHRHRATLWLRDLRTNDARPLAGTTGGTMPFWSPGGEAIAFFADGRLRRLTIASGTIDDLADAPSPRGGAWHARGDIVFAPTRDGGLVLRRADGSIHELTSLDTNESSHRFPQFFGDDHVLFFVRSQQATRQGIWIAPLDQPETRKRLAGSTAEGFAIDGSLVYANGSALVAQAVNLEALSLSRGSHLLGSPVGTDAEGRLFATAGGDLLLYGEPPSQERELRWVDAGGTKAGTVGERMIASDVRIAPDGRRVATARVDPQLRTLDIWIYEDQRPVPRRLSTTIDVDESPAWSRDGRRVAWASGGRSITIRDSRGASPDRVVRKLEHPVRVTDWSPDGRWLIVSATQPQTRSDIVLLGTSDAAELRPYAQTPFDERFGTVSPDGRWLAYASDESGQFEIYVDSYPSPQTRARVSLGGGTEPRWGRDGQTLFYRRGSSVHRATLTASSSGPEVIATSPLFDAGTAIRSFDVAPDGQRWLLNVAAEGEARAALFAIVNVRSLLPSAP